MFKLWLAVFAVTFVVSVITLSYVQIRAMVNANSWVAFRNRRFFDLYWNSLSLPVRLLLWPGFVAFGITLLLIAVRAAVR